MIARLLDAVRGVSFGRGLAIGAMVGAAIAGSTIWSRLRASAERRNDRAAGESGNLPDRAGDGTG